MTAGSTRHLSEQYSSESQTTFEIGVGLLSQKLNYPENVGEKSLMKLSNTEHTL